MAFRYFLSSALVAMLFHETGPFVQFGKGHYEKHFYELIFSFGLVDQEMLYRFFVSTALVAICSFVQFC